MHVQGLVSLTSWALLAVVIPMNKAVFASALFTSLYLISIAQGGYNPCLQAFGADQLEGDAFQDHPPCRSQQDEDEERSSSDKKKSKFFQWWYLGVCTGSLLGVTLMSYIQDNYGWGWGFAIPAVSMAFSTAFFTWGNRHYTRKPLAKSNDRPMEALFQSIKNAVVGAFLGRKITLPNNDGVVDIELA